MTAIRVAGIGLLVMLAACSPQGKTVSEGPDELTIEGRLGGSMQGSMPCSWVETDDGRRVEVTYLNAWSVEADPVRIIDDAGDVVAVEGDRLRIRGQSGEVGASLCESDLLFSASLVTNLTTPLASESPR